MENNKGSIVYFGGFEMPDRNAAAHRVLNNAKIFRNLGYKVVFAGIDKTIQADKYEPDVFYGFESYPERYPKNAFQWLKSMLSSKHIKRVIKKIDDVCFVVAYNMHAKPLSSLMKYCKKHDIKVIADVTEWYENDFSLSPIKFIRWYDTKKVMTKLQKKVNGIISISTYLTEYYRNSVGNIVQIPPLTDIDDDVWKKKPENFSAKTEFVYSGSPGRDKDRINLIIDAFSTISMDYIFTVVGITKDQFIESYPDYAAKLNLMKNKVDFRGRVSHDESIASLKKADYCIFIRNPSRKNNAGFPTKFVECLTSGVGVIANDISNIKDYFPIENGYLLNTTDIESIKKTIENCISKGKISHKVSDVFDYRKYHDDLDRFLTSLEKKTKTP